MPRIPIAASRELTLVARLFLLEELMAWAEGQPASAVLGHMQKVYAKDLRELYRAVDTPLREAGYIQGKHTRPQPVRHAAGEGGEITVELEWSEDGTDPPAAAPPLWSRTRR